MSVRQYTRDFYTARQKLTQDSAEIILDIVFSHIQPASAIDLGCGTGTWLAQCRQLGARTCQGVDGDWVDADLLEIENEQFVSHDLGTETYRPTQRFDLAICIEVAEHLSPEMGDALVDSLAEASDIVLFSAAIKGQGGTDHINEQPQYYWASRFLARDYFCVDLIRPRIWEDERVNVIYKQNMLLYVKSQRCSELNLESSVISKPFDINRVHPDLFLERSTRKKNTTLSSRLRALVSRLKNFRAG